MRVVVEVRPKPTKQCRMRMANPVESLERTVKASPSRCEVFALVPFEKKPDFEALLNHAVPQVKASRLLRSHRIFEECGINPSFYGSGAAEERELWLRVQFFHDRQLV